MIEIVQTRIRIRGLLKPGFGFEPLLIPGPVPTKTPDLDKQPL